MLRPHLEPTVPKALGTVGSFESHDLTNIIPDRLVFK